MLGENRIIAFGIGICAHVLWIWYAPAQAAGEGTFEASYEKFHRIEEAAKLIRESHGDESYLLTLFAGHHIYHAASLYQLSGAHPEIGPPNKTSWEDQGTGIG